MIEKTEQDTIGLLVHSYNNFLAGMMGFTELSLMEVEQEDVRERLELVLTSGKEAVTFGKQLLSLTSRLQVILKPVHLLSILEEVASGNHVEFINEGLASDTQVKSDAQWFWHCIESLCQFSRQFIFDKEDKELKLKISLVNDKLEINLFGNSLKLNEEQAERIFEPFYSSRHLLGGKDVGIGYIKGFVLQMKGDMTWSEEKGFVIELPLVN